MLELGDVAVVAHQQVGRKLAQSGIEIVITVGKLAQYIAEAAKQGGVEKVIACDSHDHAKENLKQILKPGDTLLVKGSRGMKMETILNELM
jgi:UDP-N-acetylmuramyl pentapeptide synthase